MNAISGVEQTGKECRSKWQYLQSEVKSKEEKQKQMGTGTKTEKISMPHLMPEEKNLGRISSSATEEIIATDKESCVVQDNPERFQLPSAESQLLSSRLPHTLTPSTTATQSQMLMEWQKCKSCKKMKHHEILQSEEFDTIESQRLFLEEERLQTEQQRLAVEEERLQVEKQRLALEKEAADMKGWAWVQQQGMKNS